MNNLIFGLPIMGIGKTIIDIPVDDNLISAEIEVMETGTGKQKVSIVTLHDVTEHRRLAEKMTSQIDLLLNNEQHQDKLFGMIAHDLRSPFNVLLNLTEAIILEYQGMSEDEIIKHLNIIYRSSQKVFNLLVNLLDWSRIKTGSWKQFPQSTNIGHVVSEVFTIFDEMAARKNITLTNKVPASTQLLIDLNILQAILRNLVSNAIKFTSSGGYVAVYAEDEPNQLKLWVEDNGTGMSEEKLNNLFDRDHMGEKTHPDSGTGLGLYLCKELVEISGGTLEITSAPIQGTTVCCVFRVNSNPQ
jgi:signal transduction histidine kinase